MESPFEGETPVFATPHQVVDPQVSRAKFDRELARFRAGEALQRRRGVLLLRAEFPVITLAFATTHLPLVMVLFGARLDFTDYDHRPPSVTLVNPFTEEPYPAGAVPTNLFRRLTLPDGTFAPQPLVQAHEGHLPFVCMRGVREYHEHPAHTGDSWHLYRRSERGTLSDLAEQLYLHGIAPLVLNVQVVASGLQVHAMPDIRRMPGDPLPVPADAPTPQQAAA